MDGIAAPLDSTTSVIDQLKDWVKQPFSAQMDLFHWFLWTGLVIVLVIAWTFIIHELEVTI